MRDSYPIYQYMNIQSESLALRLSTILTIPNISTEISQNVNAIWNCPEGDCFCLNGFSDQVRSRACQAGVASVRDADMGPDIINTSVST